LQVGWLRWLWFLLLSFSAVNSSSRIPSLDGLRGVAVSLVLLAHSIHALGLPVTPLLRVLIDLATVGVLFFFVLSGFLITWLLVQERQRTGRIALGHFYMRRSLRILPPAYLFIAAVAAASALGRVVLQPGDLVHALTFTVNFHQGRAWALGNLWSLGVEEQFYLIWPLVLAGLGMRRAGWLALGTVAAVPLLRLVAWECIPGLRAGIDEHFEFVCDGLATGCVVGLLVARYGARALSNATPRSCFVLAPVIVLACTLLSHRAIFSLLMGSTLTNISIAVMILWCMTHADSLLGRLLNSRVGLFAGAISYPLYLWQQIFLDPATVPRPSAVPLAILLAVAAATASYFLLERPLQYWRRRLQTISPVSPSNSSVRADDCNLLS
jgi:peptidoglycan/LPS O-acetylase OafA/YrhL